MNSPVQTERFTVTDDDLGLRLDQLLAKHIPVLSRRKARLVIDLGGVFVDKARVKVASRATRTGQRIEVHLGGVLANASTEVSQAARAEDAAKLPDFVVVYEDDDVVVVDKPAGLITAPTPESDRGNLADQLARRVGKLLEEELKVSLPILNVPGATRQLDGRDLTVDGDAGIVVVLDPPPAAGP